MMLIVGNYFSSKGGRLSQTRSTTWGSITKTDTESQRWEWKSEFLISSYIGDINFLNEIVFDSLF